MNQLISAGYVNNCAIIAGAAKCWGGNNHGALGNGTTDQSDVPVDVSGLDSGVTSISLDPSDGYDACAIVNGGAKCWGYNGSGNLGDGTTTESLIPIDVSGLDSGVTSISTGYNHTCAVVNGSALCWGLANQGQLGNGSSDTTHLPVQVSGLDSGVTQVSSSYADSCAIVNGGAKCWGHNQYGQSGNGTNTENDLPVDVSGLDSGVDLISVCYADTCAIVNGGAKCWGRNYAGELGNGSSYDPSLVPVDVVGLDSGVTAISTTYYDTCAVVNGGAKCWGKGSNGQLGNNDTYDSSLPVDVSGLDSGVTAIASGYFDTCAIVNGHVKCWGTADNNGALGNGNDNTFTTVPIDVSGL